MSDFTTPLTVICLESEAFYALVDQVVQKVTAQQAAPPRWIGEEEALTLLHIRSKTTLQKYRDEGHIRYSQPSRKVILYDRESLLAFLDKHAQEPFA